VTTKVPTVQHVCSSNDLQQARAACSGGANSSACQAFFAFEQAINPTCATCLAPFDVPFSEATALFKCVSPFVSASCNHDTGCVIDCTDKSCEQCSSGNVNQCRQNVGNQQCAQFFDDAACSFPAFFGAGAFCNPSNYSNFGGWIQGVGGHFCGP
jgi:hypothetical protein